MPVPRHGPPCFMQGVFPNPLAINSLKIFDRILQLAYRVLSSDYRATPPRRGELNWDLWAWNSGVSLIPTLQWFSTILFFLHRSSQASDSTPEQFDVLTSKTLKLYIFILCLHFLPLSILTEVGTGQNIGTL